MLGQHLCESAFIPCLFLKMAALFLSFLLVFVASFPQDSCYNTRYQEKKEAKEEGQHHLYHKSKIFSRNSCFILVAHLCHGSLLGAIETIDASTILLPFSIVAPNTIDVLLIKKKMESILEGNQLSGICALDDEQLESLLSS